MIRRLSNTRDENSVLISQLSLELEQLLPSQTQINQEIILNENRLKKNKEAIEQLLQSLSELRALLQEKTTALNQNLVLLANLKNEVQEKLVDKSALEATLEIRRDELAAVRGSPNTTTCNTVAIQYQENIINQSRSNQTILQNNLTSSNVRLSDIDQRILSLKNQLEAAEAERDSELMKKY